MTSPLVSVVLSGYNQGEYLVQAVESVLGQTYPNLELILIDNGSTDGSREIARRYENRPNVRVILNDASATVTKRWNEAIAASSGELISFLCADDWYLPDKIALQVAAFGELPGDYGVVYAPGYRRNVETGAEWLDGTPSWSGWVLQSMLRDYHRAWLNMDSPLVRRACYLRYPFDEDLFAEGEAVFLRMAIRYRFHPISVPLVVVREHRGQLGKAYEPLTRMNLTVLERLERQEGFPTALVPLLDRVRAAKMRNLGWQMIRLADDPVKGRAYLRTSLRWGHHEALHPRFVVGMALSTLPRPALTLVNRLAHRLRRHRENIDVRVEFVPGSKTASARKGEPDPR